MSSQEYSIYIDSYNRELKLDSDPNFNNVTNDVVIPIKMPTGRMPVAELHLGSLELPLAQYTVEDEWKNIYFDEGLTLIPELTEFVVTENGTPVVAQLPPTLNPIVAVDNNNSTSPIFTTQYPHGLNIMDAYTTWNQSIQLISTPITDSSVYNLNSGNASLMILSDTQFTLELAGAIDFQIFGPNSYYGYVHAPTIPNPTILAAIVTAGLQYSAPNHWLVTYSEATGRFKITWVGGVICNAEEVVPAYVSIQNCYRALASIMGFGQVDIQIPVPVREQNFTSAQSEFMEIIRARDAIPQPREYGLCAPNCYQCKAHIEIDVGNYGANELGANMSRQWNRFYFDQGCLSETSTGVASQFVYSDACGVCYSIDIYYGKYTPEQLAAYIQSEMSAQITDISVTYSLADASSPGSSLGVFIFSASEVFGLEWDQSVRTQDLATRMGFLPIGYHNLNYYESSRPFFTPVKGCCSVDNDPLQYTSYVYSPFVLGNERKFSIERSKPRPQDASGTLTGTAAGLVYDPVTNVTTIITPFAHGFQVGDVIGIRFKDIQPGSDPTVYYYYFVVDSVVDWQTFTIDAGSVDLSPMPGPDGPPTGVCVYLDGPVVGNLYFTACDTPANVKPSTVMSRILGYAERDYFPDPNLPTWTSPACFSLDWPTYLLMTVTDPVGDTHSEHSWGADNMTQILSKIILYPQYRLERSFPMQMQLPDLRVINRMRIAFLNPDHSLYHMHGRDWSGTIVMTVIEKKINQLCY